MKTTQLKEELAKKIQQCLKDAGYSAEIDISDHEAIVHTKIKTDDQTLRVVAQITDREATKANAGQVPAEISMMRRMTVKIRPTLSAQAATAVVSERKQKDC